MSLIRRMASSSSPRSIGIAATRCSKPSSQPAGPRSVSPFVRSEARSSSSSVVTLILLLPSPFSKSSVPTQQLHWTLVNEGELMAEKVAVLTGGAGKMGGGICRALEKVDIASAVLDLDLGRVENAAKAIVCDVT